jgi:hypothetical protein
MGWRDISQVQAYFSPLNCNNISLVLFNISLSFRFLAIAYVRSHDVLGSGGLSFTSVDTY